MNPVTNYCAAILGENQTAMSAIRLIPELAGCSDDLLQMIYTYSKTVDAEPGEVLIQEGMFDQWVYFIIRGEMDVMINGQHMGSTRGPIVGERCILGEPRGADLIAGKDGLMALGVELSIIDEINRDINNFQQTAPNDEAAEAYANQRMAVALELYTIILNDVTGRIAGLHETGKQGASHLSESDAGPTVSIRGLYDFSGKKETTDTGDDSREFLLYSFGDFAEIVYYEILQKYLSDFGFMEFPLDEWKNRFAADEEGKVYTEDAFEWLHQDFGIPTTGLVEIASTIFEIASRYTAQSNKALNLVFSSIELEEDKKRARESSGRQNTTADQVIIDRIRADLFDPMDAGRASPSEDAGSSGTGKMSQADIDALFG